MCLAVALLLDILIGDPQKIPQFKNAAMPHPVVGIGKIISFYERKLFNDNFKSGLIFCCAVIFSVIFIVSILIFAASFNRYIFIILQVYSLYSAIAWRSLKDETLPVAVALFKNNLDEARYFLSRVVGRDTENSSEPEIVRAAVETIAENLIDGVISVLFFAALGYFVLGGIGMIIFIWLFKTASTLDSMVGYDNERYKNFGTASAKLDDILNFIPARIGGIVIILAGFFVNYNFLNGLKIFIRDRKKHKSPNSAHGESAFAGLMGLKLGGGAFYNKVFEERPWLGDELKTPEPLDILRAHKLMDASVALFAILLIIAANLI